MKDIEPTSIIFWNTLYRANPEEQLAHLFELQEQTRLQGVGRVLFCLSEVSSSSTGDGLKQLLETEGLDVRYAPTSKINQNTYEGIAIAALEGIIESSSFTPLTTKRGIRNIKTRHIGEAVLSGDNLHIATGHLSYPAPTDTEIQGVIETNSDVFGGDLNTVTNQKIVSELESADMKKVTDPEQKTTFPLGVYGLELDHAFVTEELVDRAKLTVADKGPSNHRPIILTVN